jgi:hypothetical protein
VTNSGKAAIAILGVGILVGGLAALAVHAVGPEPATAPRSYRSPSQRMKAEKRYRREMRRRIHTEMQRT